MAELRKKLTKQGESLKSTLPDEKNLEKQIQVKTEKLLVQEEISKIPTDIKNSKTHSTEGSKIPLAGVRFPETLANAPAKSQLLSEVTSAQESAISSVEKELTEVLEKKDQALEELRKELETLKKKKNSTIDELKKQLEVKTENYLATESLRAELEDLKKKRNLEIEDASIQLALLRNDKDLAVEDLQTQLSVNIEKELIIDILKNQLSEEKSKKDLEIQDVKKLLSELRREKEVEIDELKNQLAAQIENEKLIDNLNKQLIEIEAQRDSEREEAKVQVSVLKKDTDKIIEDLKRKLEENAKTDKQDKSKESIKTEDIKKESSSLEDAKQKETNEAVNLTSVLPSTLEVIDHSQLKKTQEILVESPMVKDSLLNQPRSKSDTKKGSKSEVDTSKSLIKESLVQKEEILSPKLASAVSQADSIKKDLIQRENLLSEISTKQQVVESPLQPLEVAPSKPVVEKPKIQSQLFDSPKTILQELENPKTSRLVEPIQSSLKEEPTKQDPIGSKKQVPEESKGLFGSFRSNKLN